jgi:signal peptidase I
VTTNASGRPRPRPRQEAGRGDRIARWLALPVLALFVSSVFVFFVYFQSVRVSGPSMLPGLLDGDYLLITKGYTNPVRGDVVVFNEVENGQTIDVVKRVIAIPGDTVEVTGDVAKVNGSPEPSRDVITGGGPDQAAARIPPATVYVLGDNRPVSLDSRIRGPIPLSRLRGRAVFRFAPVTRMGLVR